MTDPCLPALHTPATPQSWRTWNAAHPWVRPLAIAAGCAAAVAVPVAVFYPYAPPPPVIVAPVLAPLPSAGSAGQANSLGYVPTRETSPVFTDFPTPSPVSVPEPASLALLAVGAGGAVLVRRRRS